MLMADEKNNQPQVSDEWDGEPVAMPIDVPETDENKDESEVPYKWKPPKFRMSLDKGETWKEYLITSTNEDAKKVYAEYLRKIKRIPSSYQSSKFYNSVPWKIIFSLPVLVLIILYSQHGLSAKRTQIKNLQDNISRSQEYIGAKEYDSKHFMNSDFLRAEKCGRDLCKALNAIHKNGETPDVMSQFFTNWTRLPYGDWAGDYPVTHTWDSYINWISTDPDIVEVVAYLHDSTGHVKKYLVCSYSYSEDMLTTRRELTVDDG